MKLNAYRRSAALLLLALLPGCSWPTDRSTPEGFEARSAPPHLVLANRGDRPVYYQVFEKEVLPLVYWVQCTRPECPNVAPGQEVRIPFSAISGFEKDGDVAAVYWWHLVSEPDGGHAPDAVARVEWVRLR